MSIAYPPAVFRPPFRRAFRLPFRSPAGIEGLIASAIGNFDEEGIVTDGSGFVTAWNNSASIAGALPDLDVVVGTLANSSVTIINGHDAILSTGSYGLESSAGQTIPIPYTTFIVWRATPAAPAIDLIPMDARSNLAERSLIFSNNASSDNWTFSQGATLPLVGSYDTALHVVTIQGNGDGATTKFTISGKGSVEGNGGTQAFDFGSFFTNNNGSRSFPGSIAQILNFASALSGAKIAQTEDFLFEKFNI